jgi:GPH family glycoside/pentoside/hexuronide:cation symporter
MVVSTMTAVTPKPGIVSFAGILAYSAPVVGCYFFYVPMWSILPGVYAKYYGLSLVSIAAVVLAVRLFDGFSDLVVGVLSDWHRQAGHSRKPWVVVGGIGVVVAGYYLFDPPRSLTPLYYLMWSLAFFAAFAIMDIPHATWGSELSMDYHLRAEVFGLRNIAVRLGNLAFYALPLAPMIGVTEFSPRLLKVAVSIGLAITIAGLLSMIVLAPKPLAYSMRRPDRPALFFRSFLRNKPLLIYSGAYASIGLSGGMWYALIYLYLESYLHLGTKVPIMFVAGSAIGAVSTPLLLRAIRFTNKPFAWAAGVAIYTIQLVATLFIVPGGTWLVPFALIVAANVFFACHDTASLAILGDIADYGRWKFRRDRSATYFAFNTLLFKVGLGVGGGASLGIAGLFGYDATATLHDSWSIIGLKIGLVGIPLLFALVGFALICSLPLNRRRHSTIRRRLESIESRDTRLTVWREWPQEIRP